MISPCSFPPTFYCQLLNWNVGRFMAAAAGSPRRGANSDESGPSFAEFGLKYVKKCTAATQVNSAPRCCQKVVDLHSRDIMTYVSLAAARLTSAVSFAGKNIRSSTAATIISAKQTFTCAGRHRHSRQPREVRPVRPQLRLDQLPRPDGAAGAHRGTRRDLRGARTLPEESQGQSGHRPT